MMANTLVHYCIHRTVSGTVQALIKFGLSTNGDNTIKSSSKFQTNLFQRQVKANESVVTSHHFYNLLLKTDDFVSVVHVEEVRGPQSAKLTVNHTIQTYYQNWANAHLLHQF